MGLAVWKRVTLFLISFALWLLLVWPFGPEPGQVRLEDIYVGLGVAALVALVMREFSVQLFGRLLNPVRYFWFMVYLAVFLYHLVKANFDVAYRVLHPKIPIHPGIVKVKSTLKTETALTVLANSITLTPGTLTVEVLPDGTFYVHWMNILGHDQEEFRRRTIGRYEALIRRVFE
ncbi:MAG: Na+/H+ antiporter subunit E [candidate division FCPU426 bacterium]